MPATLQKILRSLPFLSLTALLMTGAIACGGGNANSSSDTGDDGDSGLVEDRVFARAEAVFTMDDLISRGYKKSKEFETETLGGASEAWYGFFAQKDIEVWVYESHQEALTNGVPIAETVISKEAGQTDFLIPVVNRYPAFAVAGNLLMLCERELATCEALVEKLP